MKAILKRSILPVWLLVMLAAGLVSCEEKHISELPAFAGFRVTPTTWHSGDSVTVTAVQRTQGNLLFKAKYSWSVSCPDTTFSKTYEVVYDADKSDPYISFHIPENISGNANISFSAEYHYSATSPTSIPSASTGGNGLIGSIGVPSSSTLYGRCSGSASMNILPAE